MAQFVTHIQPTLVESSHHHVPHQHHHKEHHSKEHHSKEHHPKEHHGKESHGKDIHGKEFHVKDPHSKESYSKEQFKDHHLKSEHHVDLSHHQFPILPHTPVDHHHYEHEVHDNKRFSGHYVDSHGHSHAFQSHFTDSQGIYRDYHGHAIEKDLAEKDKERKRDHKDVHDDKIGHKEPTRPQFINLHGENKDYSDGNTSFLRAARNGQLDRVLEHLKANIDINTSNANGLNALHLASKDGHVQIVEELLKRGAVVDAATKKGNTALHIASLAGQEEVVKLLIQHGASVNVQSQNGFTPLYMAAQENHDNVVKYLLLNGANQSLSTEDGFTPLAVAMQQGHDKVVTVLLENDTRGKVRLPALHIAAKKDDVKAAKLLLENDHNPDVTSKSGFTPLHIASHYGNQQIANLLIQKGADVNYAAKHNITPLHVAAKWGKTNMVSTLLENGATIEAKTRDGLTPLHCAARSGHEQVVDILLEKGAPISSKTKNGLAPLHMAAQGDHVDAARILLYHRTPVDEVTVDYLTALHVAAHCGHVRVAKLLLDRQADANARALNGFTPLHIACKKNRIKVVELLLKHGASIGATTESGLTPLHVASFMGCMNIVIYLLQHDASPDVPTVRGETPFHLAARANQTDIMRILLRNGAQVDARAREQQTPLHIASRLGNVDIVMLLLQHGAKVDNTTKDMYTALHIATKEGQDEVAAILIDNGASLDCKTKKGFTPLHLAAKCGHIKVAKLLLQKEAPVDAQGKNGVTPLHVASHYDHQNVALLLLDKGASPHATAKNGYTPLHTAARKNQMDIANTLLEYGANPNAESKAGFTPLHLSSQVGHTDMTSLLLEHKANPNCQAKNGLTPLHLCAQEDQVSTAEICLKNDANIESTTKAGYTPLHVACHYGQLNMVKFLLLNGADVQARSSLGYTPLHQAAQQGHTNVVNILLEHKADPNSVTSNGQTPLDVANKLGYITVIETLKVATTTDTSSNTDEKYRVVVPEAMNEAFMSDSEEEGGEDTLLGDQTYRYLTADEMKSLGDDSLPIDVTRDERIDSNRMITSGDSGLHTQSIDETISPEHLTQNYVEYIKKYQQDNVDFGKHATNIGFLVSFLVDARGGAMRGCRHSGVRVIVPPRSASSPTRITCRYVRPQRTPHPPPLMEGEALASRVLELGPVGAKFLGPVIIEVPHFAALHGKEREIVILRSDNGESWKEHTVEAREEILNEVLHESFEAEDLNQLEDISSGRITRILTQDFPQYFAVVSRIRQEVHAIGPEGGMVSSTVVPQVQAVFPEGALTKKIKVGLQAQPIDPELTAKLLGHGVAVSPVVTVEPRRRKFHKAITLSMPAPRAHSQGMINQYSGSAPTLRLLCSITGGTTRAQWEDVTGSTPLTFVNDCVSFTTTVSARFWLMDCRNIADATKMATELYKEAIHVPFMAKFVVFAKRIDPLEARLRVFCMTDDKEDKTLEHQEHFKEVAKSRDVEVLEGKSQYIEFAGNLIPITKSGEQLQFSFRAFRENRLPFSVRVKDQHAEAVSRCLFMKERKVAKGEPPQQPICILNIVLPDDIVTESIPLHDPESHKKNNILTDNFDYYRPDPRIADISNLLGEDWIPLATQLGLTSSEINVIKSEYPESIAKQGQSMLRMWLSQTGNTTHTNMLENAIRKIGREDIIPQCLNIDPSSQNLGRKQFETEKHRLNSDSLDRNKYKTTLGMNNKNNDDFVHDKYSAEEKQVQLSDEEEDFNKTVTERRQQIEEKLSHRTIPASSQRVEIVQEICSIKRQSLVEDKIAEVEKTVDVSKTLEVPKSTLKNTVSEYKEENREKTGLKKENRVLDDITIEDFNKESHGMIRHSEQISVISGVLPENDPNSPKCSKTPPPSPADFIIEKRESVREWDGSNNQIKLKMKEQETIEKEHPSSGLTDSSFELTPAATKCLPEPQPRVVESPDTQLEFSKVVETSITDKQISPVRDDLLDNKTDEILLESYSDKKHFWENVSKESSTKPINLQDSSINSKIPIPKPRGTVQHSTSSEESENYFKVSLSTDKSIEYSESTPVDNRQISEEHSITPEEKILSEYQASFIPPQAVKRTHHKYDKHDFEKGDSLDSDRAQKGSSQLIENTSYISDSEDVEHYISDSEIEDRVPQIRERQMSVFAPTPIISKCAYARSASLPTEDLYEVSARSNKLRKQYYEEQIKKEMIEEQLISELEDNQSPERKILCSTDEISDNETNRTSLSMDGIENKIDNKSVLNSITTEDSYLSESIPTDNIDTIDDTRVTTNKDLQIEEKSLSRDLEEKDIINEQKQIIGIYSQGNLNSQDDLLLTHNVIKEAQSLEVHVDKSEIEDSEKITDLVGTSIIDPKDVVPVNVNKLEIADVILTETNSSSKQEISSINVPKQHVEKTIWEVPIQCNLQFNEVVTDILDDKICLVDSGSHVIESNQSKREEEFTHEKGKPENYNDIEKIILDSLYHQKVDPDEAKKIANSLIHEIESEISKSESVSTSKIPKTPTTVPSVSDYLSHLAETKGLDQREVELVKSVLARRQRELSKLSRDDTLASSMEITDEDLKYSGTELDYSHLLEQQIDQLEAEKIDTNLYDDSVTQQQDSTPITCVGEQKKLVEKSDVVLESSENLKLDKDTIFEEDETVTETNTDDSQSHQSKQPLNNSENIVSDAEKSVKYITQQNKEDIISFGNSNEIEHTTAQQNEEDITSFESPKEIGYTTTLQDKEDMIESSKEIKHTATTSYSETTSTITNTFSNIITENKQSPEVKPVLLSPSEEPRAIVEEHAILRKLKSDPDSSSSGSNAKQEQRLECETYSSSGESHYQSFEIDSGKSRPCSSDVEGLIATGSSEYESALASQIHSGKSYPTSTEYQTAISSISSKESMKSLDSESSGNLASIEVSEMSETLIPSTSDLDGDILDLHEQQIVDDDTAQLNWKNHVAQSSEISDSEILSYGGPSIDLSEDELELRQNEIQSKMKRSYEMTFQPEPKLLLHDSPQGDTVENDEKLASSLDEGSILSISVSSASSNAANRTVIEVLPKDLDEITSIDISTSTPPDANINIDSVTLTTSTIEEDGIQSVSTQVTTQSAVENKDIETPLIKEESRRKGHKRQDSYVINFSPKQSNIVDPETSNINLSLKEGKSDEKKDIDESEKHDFWDSEEIKTDQKSDREMDENSIQNTSEHENSSLVLRSHDFYLECKRSSKDISNQKQPLEKRDSHGKSSSTSSEKSSFDEAEAEAAFNMVAHISPAHKIKQICPILEDEDAEKCEEPKRIVQKDTDLKKNDQSPVFIPDIKVTEHMTPLVDKNFRYPDLELETKEKELEMQKSTPQTPASVSSKSSEETDQGREYVVENNTIILEESQVDKIISDSQSETATVVDSSSKNDDLDRKTDSPNSDSFEMLEKPDLIDDFVVIEEVAKEANEFDSEGKSVQIQQTVNKKKSKHDHEVEEYLVKSAPTPLTKMTDVKYYPDGSSGDELGFDFEDSPPTNGKNATSSKSTSKQYIQEFDRELEANKKWIEQQFQGNSAAVATAGYGYEMEFERGPLEDIKEEDITDFEGSSRIGSLGSQKESGGSLGSVKDSYSSTPEYDVLAGRKYFTRSGDHDDISMSSLQEFENLEQAMSLEMRKYHCSQDSSSNGSFKTRHHKGQGDDISVSSLKEFEGLEKACIAAHKIEIKVKEEEDMLAQIDECPESIASDSCETQKQVTQSDDDDYEKRLFEIDEIIRQAQTNVERFIDLKEVEKTESLGRGDSVEEVSKIPDLDLDAPLVKSTVKVQWKEGDDVLVTSTDSLDLKPSISIHGSTDSLDQKTGGDIMTTSTDSIEVNSPKSKNDNIMTDSIELKNDEKTGIISSDSLELGAYVATTSVDEDGSRVYDHDISISSTSKDCSTGEEFRTEGIINIKYSDQSVTSSSATHATYQYETDSVFSGSFTSEGSNTMVSSMETFDPMTTKEFAAVVEQESSYTKLTSSEDSMSQYTFYEDEANISVTNIFNKKTISVVPDDDTSNPTYSEQSATTCETTGEQDKSAKEKEDKSNLQDDYKEFMDRRASDHVPGEFEH